MRLKALTVLTLLGVMSATSLTIAADASDIEKHRERAKGFLGELRTRLQAAMAESPMAAVAVCQSEAPQIAKHWSSEGYIVRRTASRVRRADNGPTAQDLATIERFAARLAAGESAIGIEEFVAEDRGQSRYARALVAEPTCLVCHGENIAPAIVASIDASYPQDRARGFRLGDLRGIVVVESQAP
jgi:hypothetical protein